MTTPEQYWIDRGTDLIGKEVLEEGYETRQAMTYDAIAVEICGQGFSVLDVGCNVGALHQFLYSNCFKGGYCGLDTNKQAVDFLNNRQICAGEMSIREIKLTSKSYDCVVVKDVLEHLENLEPAREAFRVASKAVILSFFIPPKPGVKVINLTEQGYYHNQYDENDVLWIVAECGFKMTKRIDTWETDGNMNRTYVFERVER